MAQWEFCDDRRTRVLLCASSLLVEAEEEFDADEFDRRHRLALPSDHDIPDGGEAPLRVTLVAGSDEAGKSESDRAMAVAAVALPMEFEEDAIARGLRDSKTCAAQEIAELAEWIESRFAFCTRVIPVSEREQELRAHGGNESRLLASMHADCLRRLYALEEFAIARVDRFAPNRPVAAALASTHPQLLVDECVRGERFPAVAAASVLARFHATPRA